MIRRLEQVLDPIARWDSLSRVGQVQALKTSYFFFLVVPVLARLLSHVGKDHVISILGAQFHIHLDLPFSWKVFYFASVFFSLGALIYQIRCPAIIKDFRNFADFKAQGA